MQADKKDLAERNKINSEIIINLNKSVSAFEISRESAIYTLIIQGIKKEEAEKLISVPQKKQTDA